MGSIDHSLTQSGTTGVPDLTAVACSPSGTGPAPSALMRRKSSRSTGAIVIAWFTLACGSSGSPTGPGRVTASDSPTPPNDVLPACTGGARILASSYDQSCSTVDDCARVGEGDFCYRECQPCPYAVINVGALPKYGQDVAAALSGDKTTVSCGVCGPAPFPACCVVGKCHADSLCTASSSDAALE
jgi:hypothetical protein